jgi:5-methylcytosine-specific restriction endonuclease McrA
MAIKTISTKRELRWDNPDDRNALAYRAACRRLEKAKQIRDLFALLILASALPQHPVSGRNPDILRAIQQCLPSLRPEPIANGCTLRPRKIRLLDLTDSTCFFCGCSLSTARVTTDHLIPVCLGGGNHFENCVPACAPCNTEKSGRMPTDAEIKRAGLLHAKP